MPNLPPSVLNPKQGRNQQRLGQTIAQTASCSNRAHARVSGRASALLEPERVVADSWSSNGIDARSSPVASSSPTLTTDGPPRFSSPWPQNGNKDLLSDTKPVMIYLPGIDGSGFAAYRQFDSISQHFSLQTFTVPVLDRTPFPELVDFVVSQVQQLAANIDPDRPIYLFGESFGAILAIAVASRCPNEVDRLVLVNPATSYLKSVWPQAKLVLANVPENLYPLLPYALAPVIGNPIAMAAHKAIEASTPLEGLAALRDGLLEQLPMLGRLDKLLPQETLLWRLDKLEAGCKYIDDKYSQTLQRTLVIAGDADLMLPSAEEAKTLTTLLPNCRTRVLPNRSHALLQEAGVDLVELLKEEGFYVERKRMTGAVSAQKRSSSSRTANNFGRPLPIELPTPKEYEVDADRIGSLREFVSPVFFSTAADGTVMQGLDNLPLELGKPALLVGNHQTMPIDTGFHVSQIYKETGVMPRGLTHPIAFASGPASRMANGNAEPMRRSETSEDRQFGLNLGDNDAVDNGGFLTRWGAVPVGPKNFFSLLRNGECVLLFPGGATEALKGTRTVDKYQLFWSPKPEFVRVAARFGATIIPFGAVGSDDSFAALLSAESLLNSPLTPSDMRERMQAAPSARRGVTSVGEGPEVGPMPKLYLPSSIERYYFLYGKPVHVDPEMGKDKDAVMRAYEQVQRGCEDCLTYLIEQRENDPYRNTLKRLWYERRSGTQAPTFTPPADVKLPLQ